MIEPLFSILNNSRYFNGIMNVLMQIGSRFITSEIPTNLQLLFENIWIRRFFIFCVIFIATRDIKMAIFLTLIYIIIFSYLFNSESNICIINKENIYGKKNMNNDIITSKELVNAKKIIDKYNKELEDKKIKY